jgi:hypothetical protein
MAAFIDIPIRRSLASLLAAAVALTGTAAIPFMAGNVLERLHWKGAEDAKPFVDMVENRSGIITVDADGTVFGHGMYDGRFNTDIKQDSNGIVRPYALSLFHPAPRRVLMIGFPPAHGRK